MLSFIPNLFTSLNLFLGILSILFIIKEDFLAATYLFVGSLICDFLDGFFARILNVKNNIGKELDSLADLISFGFAPGFIMFKLIGNIMLYDDTYTVLISNNIPALSLIGFLITIFSAFRLAKFNIDERQTNNFLGLPTPANSIFFYSLPLIMMYHPDSFISELLKNHIVLINISTLFSLLLVLEIPLFSLKFKNLSFADNKYVFIFIVLCLILIFIFKLIAVPFLIILYILISLLQFSLKKNK